MQGRAILFLAFLGAQVVTSAAAADQEVLARIEHWEPKSMTDELPNGELLVSDMLDFVVVEPAELAGIVVRT